MGINKTFRLANPSWNKFGLVPLRSKIMFEGVDEDGRHTQYQYTWWQWLGKESEKIEKLSSLEIT